MAWFGSERENLDKCITMFLCISRTPGALPSAVRPSPASPRGCAAAAAIGPPLRPCWLGFGVAPAREPRRGQINPRPAALLPVRPSPIPAARRISQVPALRPSLFLPTAARRWVSPALHGTRAPAWPNLSGAARMPVRATPPAPALQVLASLPSSDIRLRDTYAARFLSPFVSFFILLCLRGASFLLVSAYGPQDDVDSPAYSLLMVWNNMDSCSAIQFVDACQHKATIVTIATERRVVALVTK